MKKLHLFYSTLVALTLSASFVSCSNDDNEEQAPKTPSTAHYDITVTVGNHGGMNKDKNGHLIMSLASLEDADSTIEFSGKGAEITDYTIESIYDGTYYYQIPPKGNGRFSKLQFKDNQMQVIQEQPFVKNTYTTRNYTHAWINDSTLIIMASNGDNNKILWTKLNTNDMRIIAEDELAIPEKEGYTILTTSGLLTYRKSDGKLFYFYYWKTKKRNGVVEPNFHVAVINPETMAVEQDNTNTETGQMQGSAYGELMQSTIFYDDDDNLYLSAFNEENDQNIGCLIRIKKGEYNFEAGYNAFPNAKGKLQTVQYLGNNKALAYAADNTISDDYASYYAIIDLKEKSVSRVKFNGADLPYCSGTFSQRSVINTKAKKAYIGVNTKDEQRIYVYDIATGNVTKGINIAGGYYFDQIRFFEK